MSSPATEISVTCPKCGARYKDWWRASLNFTLEDYSDEYVKEASSATCPECRYVVKLDTLVVRASSGSGNS